MESLLDALRGILVQEHSFLLGLSDKDYTSKSEACFNSAIGSHMRHNLDHFSCFFAGLESGRIDYEKRERSTGIETSRQAALELIDSLLDRLKQCDAMDSATPLLVREESEANVSGEAWLHSSLGRELQFLLGHTVHHDALIATIAYGLGINPKQGFGVAPSTQRHAGTLTERS